MGNCVNGHEPDDVQQAADTCADPQRRALLEFSGMTGIAAALGLIGGVCAATDAGAAQAAGAITLQNGRIRRIVTAHNAEGKSYIASDELVESTNLWNGTPTHPLGTASNSAPPGVTTATGQTRCFVAAIPPSRDPKPTTVNRIGYHRANGIAYCLILKGELVFLVDLQEVVVRAGDVVVERNTLHSWRNEGTEPVTMFIVTVSA